MPSNDLPMFGHHPYDPAVMDDDGLPFVHLDDERINDLPLPEGHQPKVYRSIQDALADQPF